MAGPVRSLIALVAILLLPGPALAERLDRMPVPGWVVEEPVPAPQGAQGGFVEDGVERLLDETQILVTGTGHTRYVRRVIAVVDRVGLEEAGAIEIEVEPESETLVLHRLAIRRDGVLIDRSAEAFTRLRRETQLAWGVIDGRITLHANLFDVRVGDEIEIAYSLRTVPVIFPNDFHTAFLAQQFWPVRRMTFRVLVPEGRQVHLRTPGDTAPVVSSRDGLTEYLWVREDRTPVDWDRRYADWSGQKDLVEIGTFADWGGIARDFRRHYAPAPLPKDLRRFAEETLRAEPDEARRVTAALRLVQDRIRYVSLAIGAGGFIPRGVGTIWESGFGDCKDKALLLVSLLDAMEIEADVALVHSGRGPGLTRRLPSPYAFDHAVVRVRSAEGDYFIDPTAVLQGGIGRDIAIPDYRFALPLAADTVGLVEVPRPALRAPVYDVVDTYRFQDPASDDAAIFEVVTTFRHDDADDQRHTLATWAAEDRAESYLEWYDNRFPGIRSLGPIEITDDLDANEIVLVERYAIPRSAFVEKNHWKRFWLNPYTVRNELRDPGDDPVEDAIALDDGLWHRHEVRLENLPAPLNPPEAMAEDRGFASFQRSGTRSEEGDRLSVTWELRSTLAELDPGTAEAWRDMVGFVDDHDNLNYNLAWKGKAASGDTVVLAAFGDRIVLGEVGLRTFFAVLIGALCLMLVRRGIRRGRAAAFEV
jgi:transglutaminase-like putative cysteine protease